jgi:Arc/MetJ-type ribon-helix-helix transcriptional regulator
VIPGRFDIYAWQRPLNWAFEWDISCGDFEVRVGEPLYNVKFISDMVPNGSYKIRLIRQGLTDALKKRMDLTRDVASIRRGTSKLFGDAEALRAGENLLSGPFSE